ncbi:hypothetical protein H2203_004056 [Taxawa tesnikishii (nom. ined.)]|nr:hypothetical protein H2203_004056 [Dothideales sp. JES 119]
MGLLRLPLEIRQEIYSYFITAEPKAHPIRGVGITAVSHRFASTELLHIDHRITNDVLDYFYTVSTWKLIFSHAFNFFRTDANLTALENANCLRKIQRVELVFFCDILLLKEYPSFGVEKFCAEIKRRATRACEVLSNAKGLRHVTISWVDTTTIGEWQEKAKILESLRWLKADVKFSIGEIEGPMAEERTEFVNSVKEILSS